MIIQDKFGNVFYLDDEDVNRDDEMGKYGAVEDERMDFIEIEALFHSLPKEQLEVMICMFLGMKPLEIVDALGFKNIARLYNISSRLRKSYQERKAAISA